MSDPRDEALRLSSQMCFPLYAAARRVTGLYQPFLQPLGLTYTQYIALLALWEQDGLSVGELGELAEIHTQLQEMGCGIVGVMLDSTTDKGMAAAPQLMEENGTNYPVVAYSADMDALLEGVTGIPTSFFVDSTGAIVGEPVVGAYPDKYLPAVQALLEQAQ